MTIDIPVRNCPNLTGEGCTLERCVCEEINRSDYVGIVGVACGAVTIDRVVQKTARGPLWPATCNRWADHPGEHKMTRGRDFKTLHVWEEKACRKPDARQVARLEAARSRAAVRLEAVDKKDGRVTLL